VRVSGLFASAPEPLDRADQVVDAPAAQASAIRVWLRAPAVTDVNTASSSMM
jgi:hypothetical protein